MGLGRGDAREVPVDPWGQRGRHGHGRSRGLKRGRSAADDAHRMIRSPGSHHPLRRPEMVVGEAVGMKGLQPRQHIDRRVRRLGVEPAIDLVAMRIENRRSLRDRLHTLLAVC